MIPIRVLYWRRLWRNVRNPSYGWPALVPSLGITALASQVTYVQHWWLRAIPFLGVFIPWVVIVLIVTYFEHKRNLPI